MWKEIICKSKSEQKKQQGLERAERQRQLEIEKSELLSQLNNSSIIEFAGVPQNIVFEGRLPKDNGKSKYGSFTVYCSASRKCYHQVQGCSSAYIDKHMVEAYRTYRPCSKCCALSNDVPVWYISYIELSEKCKHVGINVKQ